MDTLGRKGAYLLIRVVMIGVGPQWGIVICVFKGYQVLLSDVGDDVVVVNPFGG